MHKIKFKINTGIKNNNDKLNDTMEYMNNSYHMNISDDFAKYVLFLEKLIIYMHKQNIKDLALASDDEIFKQISVEYIKRIYVEVYQKLLKYKKYRNLNLNIIIYKPL